LNLTEQRLRELLHYDQFTGVFTWRVRRGNVARGSVAGARKSDGYLQIGIDGRLFLAHRLAWLYMNGEWPAGDVDHMNWNILDNSAANLRDVPRMLNMQNQRKSHKDSYTGFLGVHFDKRRGKFIARITTPGTSRLHLGQFDTGEEAHAAYLAAKRVVHAGCEI
jgi:hypothetical protein